jgi:uncharacterized membrane protein HdeD (DUF308 family)
MTDPLAVSIAKSRSWLTFTGFFFILVGIFAISYPLPASFAVEQVIGILLVVTGVFSLGAITFGVEKNHRIATVILALIRVVVGMLLLLFIKSGVLALTAVLGAFFFAEGATFILSSLALRHNRAWPIIFLNGIVAIILGVLIFQQYPSSAAWAIGLLYGINSIFSGVGLIAFAAAHPKSA